MKRKLFTVIFILILVFVSGCVEGEKSSSSTKKQEDIVWIQKQTEVGNKHSALIDWESSIEDKNTLYIQNLLEKRLVLFKDLYFEDIYKEGSNLTLKMTTSYSYPLPLILLLRVPLNSPLAERMKTKSEFNFDDFAAVVKVNRITVPSFALDSTGESEDAKIEVTIPNKIVYGELIDIVERES